MTDKAKSKTELLGAVADQAGLTRKEVAAVLDALADVVRSELSASGPGSVSLAGLVKITVVEKPAKPEATKPNPFKPGEMMTVKAKPASRVIKVRPLKTLKDMV